MNNNIYKVVGKKIYVKEDGKRYGYFYLVYPLADGSGYGFTNYSSVYIKEELVDSGFMDKFDVGDFISVWHGFDMKRKQRYIQIKSAFLVENPESDYVPIGE